SFRASPLRRRPPESGDFPTAWTATRDAPSYRPHRLGDGRMAWPASAAGGAVLAPAAHFGGSCTTLPVPLERMPLTRSPDDAFGSTVLVVASVWVSGRSAAWRSGMCAHSGLLASGEAGSQRSR